MAKQVRTIKVLSVSTHENTGGAPIAAHRIHEAVNAAKDGVESTMFVKNRQTNDPTVRSVDEFVPHHALYRAWQWVRSKIENKYWHALWRPYKATNDKNFKSDLRGMAIGNAFRKMDYDILHLHWINQRFLRLEDIPNDKPIIWTLHDSWQFCGICHYFLDCENYKHECGCCPQLGSKNPSDLSHYQWLAKQKCYADKNITIVCPSQWLADCAAASGLFRGRDIRVIPNALNTDLFKPLDIAKSVEEPIILFGANHATTDPIKGFDKLTKALALLDKRGVRAKLVVFGSNGDDVSLEYENLPVQFVGYVNAHQLVELYNSATVAVVPSKTEVFGQTASESMACGTPVVAFRCTGIQDVVGKDGGYLAEPYSEDDLARGIEWVLTLNRHGEMREQVRKSAVERFSVPVVVKQYVELYREVAK